MTDLFDVVPYIACNRVTKTSAVARPAERAEIVAYALSLALAAGLPLEGLQASQIHCCHGQFGKGVTFGDVLKPASFANGQRVETEYQEGAFTVPFAGRDAHRNTVTFERLGEDGQPTSAQTMPLEPKKGGVVWSATAVREAAGKVAKPKKARKPAPAVVQAGAPEPTDVPESVADYAEPMPEPIVAPVVEIVAADPRETEAAVATDVVERRLARIEMALGLVEAPKRSTAHVAAVRRAWNMRRAMRERAALDRAALLQANGYNRTLRESEERLRERVQRVEGFVAERAELVAEIDRLRGALESRTAFAAQKVSERDGFDNARKRLARHAATLRRELGRTRAERDGLAVNLAAMSARVARDAAAIDRLPSNQPRIILSAR